MTAQLPPAQEPFAMRRTDAFDPDASRTIPLVDKDGSTVIGTFTVR